MGGKRGGSAVIDRPRRDQQSTALIFVGIESGRIQQFLRIGGEKRLFGVSARRVRVGEADIHESQPSGSRRPVPVKVAAFGKAECDGQFRPDREPGIGSSRVAVDSRGEVDRHNRASGAVRRGDPVAELRAEFSGEPGSEQPVNDQVAAVKIRSGKGVAHLHRNRLRQIARRFGRFSAQHLERPGRVDNGGDSEQRSCHQGVPAVVAAPGEDDRPAERFALRKATDLFCSALSGAPHEGVTGNTGVDGAAFQISHGFD